MDYRFLGRTGLRVSPLCLGTMNFGRQTDEETSHQIMDRGLELGLNFFDTANVYGDGRGLTEEIIGRWFAQGGDRRDKVVLATKVYNSRSQWPNESKLSALHIRKACEESLRRLRTDHIDLYQMHHVDRDTPWEEIWQAMDLLVAHGKVLYVGSSNFAAWHIVKANEWAARHGRLGLVSEQSLYNLTARTVELEVLPACADYGVGVIPYSPLAGGLLGGVLAGHETGGRRSSERMASLIEAQRAKLEAWEKLCARIGAPPANVALAWLLRNPVVTAPIVGPRTVAQLDEALGALDVALGEDVLAELDAIFPGPGGAAPEAYAW
ncbi:MAG TPA: aldo/keto reductase [Acidimicrobiales bacterium]|nr:aldo/keto reductase [Acidimicrobiales bacterium]